MPNDKQITVEEDGQVLAQATVSVADDAGESCAQMYVAPGHLPVGTRQKLADAVHDVLTEVHARHLTATVPFGDAELVERIRDHLDDVELRAAGATSIIKGNVRPA